MPADVAFFNYIKRASDALNASNDIPFPAAVTWVVIAGHLLGGLLLLSGAYTRLGAALKA